MAASSNENEKQSVIISRRHIRQAATRGRGSRRCWHVRVRGGRASRAAALLFDIGIIIACRACCHAATRIVYQAHTCMRPQIFILCAYDVLAYLRVVCRAYAAAACAASRRVRHFIAPFLIITLGITPRSRLERRDIVA